MSISGIPKVELLLSTLNDGINGVRINENFHYLIIHQVTNGNEKKYLDFFHANLCSDNIRYLQSNTIGLSKSRNIAIDNARGDILWIMDDDTEILDSAYDLIVDQFRIGHQVVILNFLRTDISLNKTLFKKHYFNLINAAKISSINICFTSEIISKGFRFDEEFGLGTNSPSGEEYIFVTDIIRSKIPVYQSDVIGCIHRDITSGVDFYTTKNKLESKFKMFKRIFGMFGGFLSFVFLLKKSTVLYKSGFLFVSFRRYLKFFFTSK